MSRKKKIKKIKKVKRRNRAKKKQEKVVIKKFVAQNTLKTNLEPRSLKAFSC